MDTLALADAVMARLSGAIGVTVFLADVPSRPVGGYAVVWPDAGSESAQHLDGAVSHERAGFAVTCAGWSPEQALNSLRIVTALLRDWRPDPNGPPIRQTSGNSLTRDLDDPADIRWFVVRFYTHTDHI